MWPPHNALGVKILAISAPGGSDRRLVSQRRTRLSARIAEALHRRHGLRLKVIVSAAGSVEKASLLGGNPVLAEAAIAAVNKWKYAPATAPSTTEVSISFSHP